MDRKGRKCCDPFKTNHTKYSILYDVTDTLIKSAKERGVKIKLGQVICKQCRRRVKRSIKGEDETAVAQLVSSGSSQREEEMAMDIDLNETIGPLSSSDSQKDSGSEEIVELSNDDITKLKHTVNELLTIFSMDAIDEEQLRGRKYQVETLKKLITHLVRFLFPAAEYSYESEEIVSQLKEAFNNTNDRKIKMKILSLFPSDWSFSKFRKIFGETVSKHMVFQTKRLVEKNGILCDPVKKIGSRSISENTIMKVHEFYRSDNVSRACPGIREYVTYKIDGQREKVQRRLILLNLNEAFQIFKSENPGLKIGFSKFASVRPKECVLAGSTHGIHTTCVCHYHQNVKLTHDSLSSQFDLKSHNIETYRDMFKILLCEAVTEKCRLNECTECPGIDGKDGQSGLRSVLFQIIDENIYETISVKQWITVGSE